MNELMNLTNPEPTAENLPVVPGFIELPFALLSDVAGGDIGSGVIVMPK